MDCRRLREPGLGGALMFDENVAVLEPVVEERRGQRTILIIEDDDAQSLALSHRLEKQGFATAAVADGQAGIDFVRRERPDLIVLDLCLPDVDGFQVCEELADDPDTCHIPIIMLSAMERPDIIRRSRAAGCQYYVRKPYDPNALLLLIEHSLRGW